MKKVVVIAIIAVLAIGLFGTVATAASPSSSSVIAKLDAILDVLTNQIPQTEMVDGDLIDFDQEQFGASDGPIMNISVTIWKNGTNLDDFGSIGVFANYPGGPANLRIIGILDESDFITGQYQAFTYEFNAREWLISAVPDLNEPTLEVHYAVTMTKQPTQ
ncbi:hypothetical protein ACFLUS_05090 [Chloroflexota bacterium]